MSADPQEPDGADPFDRVIECLNKHDVDFMMIGGWAVIYHGFTRATEDLDVLIRRTDENSRKAVKALEEAGLGCAELVPEVFTQDNGISLGEPPLKLDVLSSLPGVDFDRAWARCQRDLFGPQEVNYISREDLIANKKAVARPKDLDDVRELEAAARLKDGESPKA